MHNQIFPRWIAMTYYSYANDSFLYYNYYISIVMSPFIRLLAAWAAIMVFRSLRRWVEFGLNIPSHIEV